MFRLWVILEVSSSNNNNNNGYEKERITRSSTKSQAHLLGCARGVARLHFCLKHCHFRCTQTPWYPYFFSPTREFLSPLVYPRLQPSHVLVNPAGS